MFGLTMQVESDGVEITLRAATVKDAVYLSKGFSSPQVHRYTLNSYAKTQEDEIDWYHHIRDSSSDLMWLIQLKGVDHPIGVTGFNRVSLEFGNCISGIVIFDPDHWGKGIATLSHYARMYALWLTYPGIYSVHSEIDVDNVGSIKAVEKVGYYRVPSVIPVSRFVGGRLASDYHFVWLNPRYREQILAGVKKDKKNIAAALDSAEAALKHAEKIVSFSSPDFTNSTSGRNGIGLYQEDE